MATRNLVTVGMSNAALSDYTVGASDYVITQTGSMSASRVLTLPAATKVPAGGTVTVIDSSWTVTATNTIVVTAAGSDTIGNAATTDTIGTAGAIRRYTSDGASKWYVEGGAMTFSVIVAGAVSDAAFAVAPPNGTVGYDSTNHKIYVKDGTWKATAALT